MPTASRTTCRARSISATEGDRRPGVTAAVHMPGVGVAASSGRRPTVRNFLAIVAAFMPLCALAACSQSEDGTTLERKRHPDAAVVTTPDAAASSSGGAGVVSCYTEGNAAQSCTLPTACCFSNYSSQHDGRCSTSACAYGTIDCDGPEDC